MKAKVLSLPVVALILSACTSTDRVIVVPADSGRGGGPTARAAMQSSGRTSAHYPSSPGLHVNSFPNAGASSYNGWTSPSPSNYPVYEGAEGFRAVERPASYSYWFRAILGKKPKTSSQSPRS